MKTVRIKISQGTKWERAIGKITRQYQARMIARSVLEINKAKKDAPKISTIAEAIEYPTDKQVLNRWRRVKGKLNVKNPSRWTPRSIPNFDFYMQQIVDREDERYFAELLFGLKEEAYLATAAKTAATLGNKAWTTSPQILDAIRTKTFKVVTTDITPSLRAQLVAKLEKTISAGFTIDETAHDLGMLNTNWRTIAKTETFDVLNKGAFDQVKSEALEYDATAYKYWQHSGNSNGRQAHIIAGSTYNQANAIPIDEPFIVDGEPMQHPHDSSGSAKNNVNCGCTGVYILK